MEMQEDEKDKTDKKEPTKKYIQKGSDKQFNMSKGMF